MTAPSSLRLLRAELIEDDGATLDVDFAPKLGFNGRGPRI